MINQTCLPCTSAAFGELSAEILCLGKSIRFQARGSSMHPLVRDGDILLVEPLNTRSPRLGDVVLCTNQAGKLLVHRVIAKESNAVGTNYLIKGDKSLEPDGWFPQEQILGTVSAIDRGSSHISMRNLLVRTLGTVVALRSRHRIGSGKIGHIAVKLFRALPIFSNLLS